MEISESGDEPRQACWPSRRTLGPSAPAKSLSNLPNIYKIPANDPFITVQHRRRVYRLLCRFIPFNKSHFRTVGVSANEPEVPSSGLREERRGSLGLWVRQSKEVQEKPVSRSRTRDWFMVVLVEPVGELVVWGRGGGGVQLLTGDSRL